MCGGTAYSQSDNVGSSPASSSVSFLIYKMGKSDSSEQCSHCSNILIFNIILFTYYSYIYLFNKHIWKISLLGSCDKPVSRQGRYHCTHFTDEEVEAERGYPAVQVLYPGDAGLGLALLS